MTDADEDFVRTRANRRCEYCHLREEDHRYTSFHIEHIVAKQHGGGDEEQNLYLSYPFCNWRKGTNLGGLWSGKLYPLFNPRKQAWHRHFFWDGTTLVGKTASGIVTIRVLGINRIERVEQRESLLLEGRFPPEET